MPVKIRLQRKGKIDQDLYRLVVSDEGAKANGKTIAYLGSVNIKNKPPIINFNKEELTKWIKNGAQISSAVRKLIET